MNKQNKAILLLFEEVEITNRKSRNFWLDKALRGVV
jgi:hypothetical protein